MEDARGFGAIVRHPQFQGGSKITGTLGAHYREYLVDYLAKSKRGNADLCAYFFLRASQLVRRYGMCGLLATNTISQGDIREVGLDQIVETEWTIPRAISSRAWPGVAALEVALIWLRHGIWSGPYLLDEKPTTDITSSLIPLGIVLG